MATACGQVLAQASLYRGTSFAVEVDVLNAAGALEVAVYAADQQGAVDALRVAAIWLRWAEDGWRGDREGVLAAQVACVAAQVEAWAAAPASWGDLNTFQEGTLRPFAGALRRLRDQAVGQGVSDAVTVWLAVLATVAASFGADAIRSYRERRGLR